jgi:5'-nucleotidase
MACTGRYTSDEGARPLTRRAFLLGSALAAGTLGLAGCASSTPTSTTSTAKATPIEGKIALIHTNDTHGYDAASAGSSSTPANFSMAAVAQLVHDYVDQGYWVLALDAGDAIQDTQLVDQSHGTTAMDFMNAVGYAAMALGNHEFDWGVDNIRSLRTKSAFPFLSANVVTDNGDTLVDPSVVFSTPNGANIGVFGLTTPQTSTIANPKNLQGITFLQGDELFACAQAQVDYLHAQGCQLIICLGHLGYQGSVEPYRSVDVLNNVTGIDVFLDGHDHLVENATVNGTLLAETGCYMHNIGVITYEDGVLSEKLIPCGSYDGIDANVNAIIAQAQKDVDAALALPVGTTPFKLDGNRSPGVRTQETNLGDLICDAIAWSGAKTTSGGTVDAAVINGGGLRTSIDAGEITVGDILAVLPYDNSVTVLSLSGAELLEALEASTFQTPDALGGFPQVSGITFTIDTSAAWTAGAQYPGSTYAAPANPGTRVTIKDVGGKGFSKDATYTIATNDFIAAGGDTYYAFKRAADARGSVTGDFIHDILGDFIVDTMNGAVDNRYTQPQGRITII